MITSFFPNGVSREINEEDSTELSFRENIEYSGDASYIEDGNENWRVKFLTSGTLTVKQNVYVDIFAVGGGGNGSNASGSSSTSVGGGGGGGGYTKTVPYKKLKKGVEYIVTVGSACGASGIKNASGEVLCQAAGGWSGIVGIGGDGGSGGGPGGYKEYSLGYPGSDGANGTDSGYTLGGAAAYTGGIGQGTTTREFGESDGDLYSGGGAGGNGSTICNRVGGDGGGGDAATTAKPATAGAENTGGGGGAGSCHAGYTSGAAGGSGIVIIRNYRN